MHTASRYLVAAAVALAGGAAVFGLAVAFGQPAMALLGKPMDDGTLIGTAVTLMCAMMAGSFAVAAKVLAERETHRPSSPRGLPAAVRFGAVPLPAAAYQPRHEEMRDLRLAWRGPHRPSAVVIAGIRGVGKTQLAAAYAHACAGEGYDLVAWLNAETSLVGELAQLADDLGLSNSAADSQHTRAALVRSHLERRRRRSLVVLDNADNPDDIAAHLPTAGTVEIVITTNNHAFTDLDGTVTITMGLFQPDQAFAYLRQGTGRTDDAAAHRVAEALGWLPRALPGPRRPSSPLHPGPCLTD